MSAHAARSPRRSERGFSLLELVVSLLIAIEILIAMAIAFDVHNRVSRTQLQITDLQQSLRIAQWDIARMVRQAGRGGLKADLAPAAVFDPDEVPSALQGRAIEVRNNVQDDDRFIIRGLDEDDEEGVPMAFAGTDILTVRGCFSTGLFQINPGTFDADGDDDDSTHDPSTLIIPNVSVAGVPQPYDDLQAELARAPVDGVLGRMLISSYVSRDDWGIAKVTAVAEDESAGTLTLTIQIADAATNTNDSDLNPLIGGEITTTGAREFPRTMNASSACLLEEYRYFVRDVREDADPITPLRPRLTRARFEPGTETPYGDDDANLAIDLADQIFDLQVALGFDSDYGEDTAVENGGAMDADDNDTGRNDTIWEAVADSTSPGRDEDDWLYNDPADVIGCDTTDPVNCDVLTLSPFVYHSYVDPDNPDIDLRGDIVDLYLVRITTAARTARPEPGGTTQYRAPDLDTRTSGDWIEDHNYDDVTEEAKIFNSDQNRLHRRRTLTTIVEMRNI